MKKQETITITPKDPHFGLIKFLAIACTKDDSRPTLKCINVSKDDNIAYGCDGYRLHYTTLPESFNNLPPGLSYIEKNLKSKIVLSTNEPGMYPDLSIFLAAEKQAENIGYVELWQKPIDKDVLLSSLVYQANISYAALDLSNKKDIDLTINIRYLEDYVHTLILEDIKRIDIKINVATKGLYLLADNGQNGLIHPLEVPGKLKQN